MGEYARLHILETYGVDIGDDDDHPRQRPKPVFRCACGKPFSTILGRDQHMTAKGHVFQPKKPKPPKTGGPQ